MDANAVKASFVCDWREPLYSLSRSRDPDHRGVCEAGPVPNPYAFWHSESAIPPVGNGLRAVPGSAERVALRGTAQRPFPTELCPSCPSCSSEPIWGRVCDGERWYRWSLRDRSARGRTGGFCGADRQLRQQFPPCGDSASPRRYMVTARLRFSKSLNLRAFRCRVALSSTFAKPVGTSVA